MFVDIGVLILLLLAWQVVFSFHVLPERYSVSPATVFQRFLRERNAIFAATVVSLTRLLAGVALGAAIGVALGLVVSQRRHLEEWVTPPIQLFAPIPIIIYAPFLVLFFGLGELFKVVLIGLSAFFLLFLQTLHAVQIIGQPYIEVARIYEKTRWKVLKDVVLPATLPSILGGIRLSLIFGWVVLGYAEKAAATQGKEGLGYYVLDKAWFGLVEEMLAGVIVLAAIGFLLDLVMAILQRRAGKWSDSVESWMDEVVTNEPSTI
ncbi:MAG TPA: ABC transporter permease [Chthoniobacterales bacterium]|nr:ABC transporter permease [Chthoniobacterales bacterium]